MNRIGLPMHDKKAIHQVVLDLREQDEKNSKELEALKNRFRKTTSNQIDNRSLEYYQQQLKSDEVLKNFEKIR
jgi:hypothetical protein